MADGRRTRGYALERSPRAVRFRPVGAGVRGSRGRGGEASQARAPAPHGLADFSGGLHKPQICLRRPMVFGEPARGRSLASPRASQARAPAPHGLADFSGGLHKPQICLRGPMVFGEPERGRSLASPRASQARGPASMRPIRRMRPIGPIRPMFFWRAKKSGPALWRAPGSSSLVVVAQTSSISRSGASMHSFTRTRKPTASLPSMMRWS